MIGRAACVRCPLSFVASYTVRACAVPRPAGRMSGVAHTYGAECTTTTLTYNVQAVPAVQGSRYMYRTVASEGRIRMHSRLACYCDATLVLVLYTRATKYSR